MWPFAVSGKNSNVQPRRWQIGNKEEEYCGTSKGRVTNDNNQPKKVEEEERRTTRDRKKALLRSSCGAVKKHRNLLFVPVLKIVHDWIMIETRRSWSEGFWWNLVWRACHWCLWCVWPKMSPPAVFWPPPEKKPLYCHVVHKIPPGWYYSYQP